MTTVDIRLCPTVHNQLRVLADLIFEENLVEIDGIVSAFTLSLLRNAPDVPQSSLYENTITSSTNVEKHNILQYYQKRTLPQPQATCTKIRRNVFTWFSSYANGQTDRHTHHST